MDKSMLTGLLMGAAAVTAVGGIASYRTWYMEPAYAEVVDARPVTKTIRTPHQVCKDQVVTQQAPVRDRVAGTAIGALVGGVLGNQIGAGSGRTLATLGGAAAGAYAGNHIQRNMQDSDTRAVQETHCRTVYDTRKTVVGYDVSYRLGDQRGTVRMDHDPGDHIPVKDGRLLLNGPVSGENAS